MGPNEICDEYQRLRRASYRRAIRQLVAEEQSTIAGEVYAALNGPQPPCSVDERIRRCKVKKADDVVSLNGVYAS